jgi:hypothetical protein
MIKHVIHMTIHKIIRNQKLIHKDYNPLVNYHMVHLNLKIVSNYVLMKISSQSSLILPLLHKHLQHLIKIVVRLINNFKIIPHNNNIHPIVLETSKIKIPSILQYVIHILIISNKKVTLVLIISVNNNLVIILKIGMISHLKITIN